MQILDGPPPRALAIDYGNTISAPHIDHQLAQKAVDPKAAETLRWCHQRHMRLILASNTMPSETRWPALQAAGIQELFAVALLSYPLGIAKPASLFYRLVMAAAEVAPSEILFVGNNLTHDVVAPMRHGMRAALVRPGDLRPGEELPDGALHLSHVAELPAALAGLS